MSNWTGAVKAYFAEKKKKEAEEAKIAAYSDGVRETVTPSVLKLALEEAETSRYEVRMGAVIFKGSRIIASGHNSIRSSRIHPLHKHYNNSLHAEQDAVLNVKDWTTLKGYSILVIRILQPKHANMLAMARPCEMCQRLLKHVGIKTMYFSNEYGEIVREKL